MVEPNVGNGLEYAEATLRTSMFAVLRPESINESKFSSWSCEVHALGLDWNTSELTVSMPTAKIKKGLTRVTALLGTKVASKSDLLKLLGSLRHLTSSYDQPRCFLSAAPQLERPFASVWLPSASCSSSNGSGVVPIHIGAWAPLKAAIAILLYAPRT